ncbi:MFS transporter [uncultured Arthrobacter sp.]|uniref:MFS transporter n=1 Tax=uncultured Arthrobacter sp. TaxID=114050 RepID=UPI0025CC11E2|nr:MFS transporter [uncultured Arthrobacter sp.]
MGILVNTGIANITTSYLWFALTFWVYLETRNVIATGVVGGAYMLLIALSSISFGTYVDRYRKLAVMRFAAGFTLVMFVLSGILFALTPTPALLNLTRPWFWVFMLIILIGAVVENLRNIALSTTVTILIEPDRRANANGLVGMVQGLMFIVTSVLSGLSVGLLGMGWTIVVALVLTALAFAHLLTLHMPEEVRAAATDAHGGFDFRGSVAAVLAVAGLFALILFSTFNNFVGGVYMALMDPYGLELFPVELWGTFFALGCTGFILGGALIGRFGLGANPLRTMLLAVILMGVLGAVFTLREWAWLYIAGIWAYLVLIPFVEAAEQTVIQQVVPLQRQGRVFGFAMAFESAAAPITAFLIAPIAQFWIIQYARSDEGAARLAPLLGEGTSRGIALVFLVAGIILILAALAAFLTPVYRRISASYAQTAAEAKASADSVSPAAR